MQERSTTFDADPRTLSSVRSFAVEAARELGAPVDPDLVALVVGELAANAAVHQETPAALTLRLAGEALEVEVVDHGAGAPVISQRRPWSTEGHRGLQIVDTLAAEWGVAPVGPGGKRVWARLLPTASITA